jgi:beta-xylosidase
LCSAQSPATSVSRVWVADLGDGNYKNPVLHADYSDPDVIRVGDDYYLTASSFNATPGLPILQSKDLVNWRIVSHVFTRQQCKRAAGAQYFGSRLFNHFRASRSFCGRGRPRSETIT